MREPRTSHARATHERSECGASAERVRSECEAQAMREHKRCGSTSDAGAQAMHERSECGERIKHRLDERLDKRITAAARTVYSHVQHSSPKDTSNTSMHALSRAGEALVDAPENVGRPMSASRSILQLCDQNLSNSRSRPISTNSTYPCYVCLTGVVSQEKKDSPLRRPPPGHSALWATS